MERVYVDMNQVDGACIGVFVSGKDVIPAGTTVYSMSVEDRDEEYQRYADEYEKIKIHRPYFRSDPENSGRAGSAYHDFFHAGNSIQYYGYGMDRSSGIKGSSGSRRRGNVYLAFAGTCSYG